MKILVVDDEPALRRSLSRAISLEGYKTDTCNDGLEALAKVSADRPDLIVLDVMMPNMDGLETCRQLRQDGNDIPVLMLTARDAVSDRVDGLDAGADDYLLKPFSLEELLARVRALLRRSISDQPSAELAYADLRLDGESYRVWRGEQELTLSRTEYKLLELLMLNREKVLTRDVIYDRVWGFDLSSTSNTVDVYIGYLRRKTEVDGLPRLIHTVRGIGYVLREDG